MMFKEAGDGGSRGSCRWLDTLQSGIKCTVTTVDGGKLNKYHLVANDCTANVKPAIVLVCQGTSVQSRHVGGTSGANFDTSSWRWRIRSSQVKELNVSLVFS